MSEEQQPRDGKKGGLKILIAAGIVIIIALLVVIIVLLLRKKEEPAVPESTGPERETLVTKENAEQVAEEFFNTDESIPQSYNVTMSTEWNFKDGTSESGDAYVENSTLNHNNVYFDLNDAGTGETYFESPIIPVGEHMDNIRLEKDLDSGTYPCVCIYHLVDDDGHTLTTVNVEVTVNILN